MDLAPIAAVAAPLIAAATKLFGGGSPTLRVIDQYLSIYERLPESSKARKVLLARVDELATQLVKDDRHRRRDRSGMGIAVVFIASAVAMVVIARGAQSWQWVWWLGAVLVGPIGLAGLGESAARVERDEKGRRLKKSGS